MKIFAICLLFISQFMFAIGEDKGHEKTATTGLILLCVAVIIYFIFVIFPEVIT